MTMIGHLIEGRSAARKSRILVAEDDDEMRALVAYALEREGFEVETASTGLALLDGVAPCLTGSRERPPYDLIIADIHMPGPSGLDILHGLHDAGSTARVILMTGFPEDHIREAARGLGAVAVFEKPFDLDDLVDVAKAETDSSR